jgi:hypothetical protein
MLQRASWYTGCSVGHLGSCFAVPAAVEVLGIARGRKHHNVHRHSLCASVKLRFAHWLRDPVDVCLQ